MAFKIKKITLWQKELANRPGTLARSLKPFADAGVNLQIIMGYVYANNKQKAHLEIYPTPGHGAERVARTAGLSPARQLHCVLMEGNDRTGIANNIARSIGGAGINMHFAIMQALGTRCTGVFGFGLEKDALKAIEIIRAATAGIAAHRRAPGGRRKIAHRKAVGAPAHRSKSGKRKSARRRAAPRRSKKGRRR